MEKNNNNNNKLENTSLLVKKNQRSRDFSDYIEYQKPSHR